MAGVLDMSKEVHKAAKSVAFQWPGVVEADDLEQEIYLHLIERPNVIDTLLNDFDDKRRLSALIKLGHQIAAGERADYEVFSGNFKYSVDDVKRKLKWASNKGAAKSIGNLSMDNDLKAGMSRLEESNQGYAEAIRLRYEEGVIPSGADQDRLSHALTALTTQMNRSHKQQYVDSPDGPGTRKVMSRAAAIAHTNREYNGENLNWDRA
jgi:hypothetical protein